MMKIAFIPIDDRPVCYTLAKQTASLDNDIEIFLPERNLLGNLTKSADIKGIFEWLKKLQNIDILVGSLDTVAYGGLIPSRRSPDTFLDIKNRLNEFKEIIKQKKCKFYACSSIMRISNNNINEEEKDYWSLYGKHIFKYSYNVHKFEETGEEYAGLSMDCSETRVPQNILNDYLLTRKRNFDINKLYIEWVKDKIINTLVFSKDDCSKYGLNVKEAKELGKISKDFNNIFIKTGADEIPLSLLSRAIVSNKKFKIYPEFLAPDYIDKISKYEDISVEKSVKSQIELNGGVVVGDKNQADIILMVNNFKKEQGELVMEEYTEGFNGAINIPEKPFFIADILNANGSDNNFVKSILPFINSDKFLGYAGWNTTGNTLGSSISCALIYFNALNKNKNAFKRIQITRFLDDWAYQANVRDKIKKDNTNLTDFKLIKNLMVPFENELKSFYNENIETISYSFPWNRFFEIEVK